MTSQIALIGIGLAVAAGVAYAELKPASNTPNAPIVSTPQPSSTPPQPSSTPTKTKSPVKAKTPAPKISKPTIPTIPTVSGGEGREHEGGDDD